MRISGGERALAILSYLSILFVVPLKAKKDSLFVQFHARQGGVLFGLWAAFSLIMIILLLTPLAGLGGGAGSNILFGFLFLATFLYAILAIIGIFKVALGERYRMPVVADVALMLRL